MKSLNSHQYIERERKKMEAQNKQLQLMTMHWKSLTGSFLEIQCLSSSKILEELVNFYQHMLKLHSIRMDGFVVAMLLQELIREDYHLEKVSLKQELTSKTSQEVS